MTLKMEPKLIILQVYFLRNQPIMRANSLQMASYEKPNVSESLGVMTLFMDHLE